MFVWFRPPKAPVIMLNNKMGVRTLSLKKYDISTNGAIFCHVMIIRHWVHPLLFMTWGNQKWKGDMPDLINRAIKIKMLLSIIFISGCKIFNDRAENIIKTDAIAWARKYLMADSVVIGVRLIIRRGIILIILISNPNQQVNQQSAEQAIIVPITRNVTKIIW